MAWAAAPIFVLRQGDNNANVIFETLTDYGSQYAMAQRYIPEITRGDKRIILVDGEPGQPGAGPDPRRPATTGAIWSPVPSRKSAN